MSRRIDDWLSRQVIPDVYPRREDPFRPGSVEGPPGVITPGQNVTISPWDNWLTIPGTRPIVYQRAVNYQISVGITALPLTAANFQVETIILNVDSSLGTSVFFGFSSSITVGAGIEVRPGTPIVLSTQNTREQWELQRVLEAMAGMMSGDGMSLGAYRAPRVVFDASDFFVIASGTVSLRVMLFPTPEYQ